MLRNSAPGFAGQRTSTLSLTILLTILLFWGPLATPSLGYPSAADSVMAWYTFMGGIYTDEGNAIAVDNHGNVYVVGDSNDAWGSPVEPYAGTYYDSGFFGTSDAMAFVVKLNPNGEQVWLSFLGSEAWDYGYAIAVDDRGNVYVGGESIATWGEPVTPYEEAGDTFVAKLNSRGELVWNTFLAGSGHDIAMVVDGNGNVYVAESRLGVTKLNVHGELAWTTLMEETVNVITVDSAGNAYVVNGSSNVAKLNSNGDLVWNNPSLKFGNATAIASDAGSNVYVAGDQSYVVKLNTNGDMVWDTDVNSGGKSTAITVGGNGNTYVANGFYIVSMLDADGELVYYTYVAELGDANGITIEENGNYFVTGGSRGTWGAPVNAYSGGTDAYATKIVVSDNLKDGDVNDDSDASDSSGDSDDSDDSSEPSDPNDSNDSSDSSDPGIQDKEEAESSGGGGGGGGCFISSAIHDWF